MHEKIKELNLIDFRGPKSSVFTGRPQGEKAREKLELDKLDKKDVVVNLIVPNDTSTLTPSFFLGLLYKSIKELGFENYKEKYRFVFTNSNLEVKQILEGDVEEGERHATNSVRGNRGLGIFLNNPR